ncbi:MAG: c-type cytochrome [Planctomycetes bacterium]|nr:c-type cytochrome [Planctomycetota bacterium]
MKNVKVGSPRLGGRIVPALLLVSLTGALLAHWLWRQPEPSAPRRGEEIARRLGCFACHGPEGRGGILDPGLPGAEIPSWEGPVAATYARDEQEIRDWILHGAARPRSQAAESAGPTPLIPMPAFRAHLSDGELEDLVAYFRAVSGWSAEIPEPAYEGRKVALRFGCFACHGPSGTGGCRNPGSFKGTIPAWDGAEFAELVRDDKELCEWILDGHTLRLWENAAARYFLQRQAIKMPAYRQHLSEDELNKLIAYIHWLREK